MSSSALSWLSGAWETIAYNDAARAVLQSYGIEATTAPKVDFSLTLSSGPLVVVLSFLDAKSLARCAGVCQGLRRVLRRNEKLREYLWRRHVFNLVRRFVHDPIHSRFDSAGPPATTAPVIDLQEQYVAMCMSLAKREKANLEAVAKTARAVEKYRSSVVGRYRGDVIGLACEVAWVNDPLLSLAISTRRKAAMHSVIVKDSAACNNLRRSLEVPQPMSVIPKESVEAFYSNQRFVPPSRDEGCLGYADELIKLRPEHEQYRVCFRAIFKDLLVWNKRSDAEACARRLGIFSEDLGSVCCLDHPSIRGKELSDCAPFLGVGGPRLNKELLLSRHVLSMRSRGGDNPHDDVLECLSEFTKRCQISLAYLRYS